ncbi:MAG TPA: hypothetical protein VFA33_19995 [Bryobacteraceae bacterium]|nr:hypothetical protein [Bryobacteraceae bacterium]
MSTSNLAIAVGVVIVVPALYKVIRQRGLRSVVTNWRRGLLTSTSLGFLAWVLLFAWHVVLQVYQDHEELVKRSRDLAAAHATVLAENGRLTKDLGEANSRPRNSPSGPRLVPTVQHNTFALAPHSVAIETANNPVFNTYEHAEAPHRHLSEEVKTNLVNSFSAETGRISISAVINDKEAWDFAKEFYDVFTAAHWSIDEGRIKSIMIGGHPWTGVQLQVCIPGIKPGETVNVGGVQALVASRLKRASETLRFEFIPAATKDGKEGDMSLLVASR